MYKIFIFFVVACITIFMYLPQPAKVEKEQTTLTNSTNPNIIFILTDDMDKPAIDSMPSVNQLLVNQGTTFSNFFVSVPLCCPSRASILTGQYAHNHRVLKNSPPEGGFRTAFAENLEVSTVATSVKSVGYKTIYLGKYLNGYPDNKPTYIPPGWDEWNTLTAGVTKDGFSFNYEMNQNGRIVKYGDKPSDYLTDVIANQAVNFIQRTENSTPFFMFFSTSSPHEPSVPAPRHSNLFSTAKAPRKPSFNERDVSLKPEYIRKKKLLNKNQINKLDALYRKRLQSLQAVDEAVARIIQTLKDTGKLENTYIIFTSDNGLQFGEHRLPAGKRTPYEESIGIPFVVRGPNIASNKVVSELSAIIDLAPTIAELTGSTLMHTVDGRSLVPLFKGNSKADAWRQTILIEHWTSPKKEKLDNEIVVPTYQGLRNVKYLYVEYQNGERELYNLEQDPFELQNLYPTINSSLKQELETRLSLLRNCVGQDCQKLENLPIVETR
ncbi:MAG: sulfatase [Acidobacteria bacterium]|nr:sulfatase [Acidobacteriota bacterium]